MNDQRSLNQIESSAFRCVENLRLASLLFTGVTTIPNSGIIVPIMGNKTPVSISDVLFSGVQQRVLGLLFGQPERSFYGNEIARIGMTGRGALQRELERMTASGLITMTPIGKQKHYQANPNSPVFQEVRGIVRKTFGLADVLRAALASASPPIRLAFIYGSVARGADTAMSDIDVMVVADGIGYSELFELFARAEEVLGRKVNPTLYTADEFSRKLDGDNHFVSRVVDQPRIMLIGGEDDIPKGNPGESGEDRETQGGAT